MLGITVQSFTSAGAGMAVAIALILGFARQGTDRLGNFWVDLTRSTLDVLIPLSLLGALFLCSQAVMQNFHPYGQVTTVEGARQTVAQSGNPAFKVSGGNIEGKEARFGIAASAVFSEVSTASSDGVVNSSHDSYKPPSTLVQMFNLKPGEVIFGGTGSGIISIILIVMVTIFIAGLMVGRSPEYLARRLRAKRSKWSC
jgi:K+-transporting ATPase A subunit